MCIELTCDHETGVRRTFDSLAGYVVNGATPVAVVCVGSGHGEDQELTGWKHVIFAICKKKKRVIKNVLYEKFSSRKVIYFYFKRVNISLCLSRATIRRRLIAL